jgi:hypothetical protein
LNTVPRGIALPEPGELWRSGAPHRMLVRVLAVDLIPAPTVEYEVLDEDGSSLTGPLRLPLDASWRGTFSRFANGAAA